MFLCLTSFIRKQWWLSGFKCIHFSEVAKIPSEQIQCFLLVLLPVVRRSHFFRWDGQICNTYLFLLTEFEYFLSKAGCQGFQYLKEPLAFTSESNPWDCTLSLPHPTVFPHKLLLKADGEKEAVTTGLLVLKYLLQGLKDHLCQRENVVFSKQHFLWTEL